MKMTNEQMNSIESAINNHPYWIQLNSISKSLYEKAGKIPTKEEYQALRNVLICKVLLEVPEIQKTICNEVWNALQ